MPTLKKFFGIVIGLICLCMIIAYISGSAPNPSYIVAALSLGIISVALFISSKKDKQKTNNIVKNSVSMSKICPICGEPITFKQKVSDGFVCPLCTHLTPNYKIETVKTLKTYWNENQNRKSVFKKTDILKDFMSNSIIIDSEHKLFYIGSESDVNNIYYKFNEVSDYEIETKTVIKKKKGLTRAAVGGLAFGGVGAVVGATTASSEVKNINNPQQIKITFNTYAGKIIKTVLQAPNGLPAFLDKCIAEKSNDTQISNNNETQLGFADEILKYKKLLDDGIITEEEFNAKKKQLLNL